MTAKADESTNRVLEIVTSIVLALASLTAAWNGFEATQWSSRQSGALNQVQADRFAAMRAANAGEQQRLIDVVLFTRWLEVYRSEDQELADFYHARFRAEFASAFTAWLQSEPLTNPNAPSTPFVMEEYQVAELNRADELEASALLHTQIANTASTQSREYIQNALYVAASLALAGFSRTFSGRLPQKVMLGFSILLLLISFINMVRLPIA